MEIDLLPRQMRLHRAPIYRCRFPERQRFQRESRGQSTLLGASIGQTCARWKISSIDREHSLFAFKFSVMWRHLYSLVAKTTTSQGATPGASLKVFAIANFMHCECDLLWLMSFYIILTYFTLFYPCIKTTVVNPQQKVGGSMCRTFSAAWRPGVLRILHIHRMPQIPKVGWMICKRMELWSSKMSSARKRSRSAGAAAVVWVSILCQWNYCIIFYLISNVSFSGSDLKLFVCTQVLKYW